MAMAARDVAKGHLSKAASRHHVWRRNPITGPSSSPKPNPTTCVAATTSFSSKNPTPMAAAKIRSSSEPTSPMTIPSTSLSKVTYPKNHFSSFASFCRATNPTVAAAATDGFSSTSSNSSSSTAKSTTIPSSSSNSTSTNRFSSSKAANPTVGATSGFSPTAKSVVCKNFLAGRSCSFGDRCRYLHCSYVCNDQSFSLLTTLTTQEATGGAPLTITGIAVPSGTGKLYSGGKDGSVRAWDCQTGQCIGTLNLGAGGVGCMITEGPWLFVGIPNAVKAWNTASATPDHPITLACGSSTTSGQVYALAEANETIYAGTHGGSILAWKYTSAAAAATAPGAPPTIQPVASLTGHKLGVVALAARPQTQRLYSGSMDHTIRVWNLATSTCLQTVTGHTSVVMSLTCYDKFLFSCSLDQTIKTWGATRTGDLEEIATRTEEHGLLGIYGVHDHQAKPVLLCSSNNDTVRLYDLPSFTERGTLFTKAEVRAMHVCPEARLFFTGDAAGEIKVWRWSATDEQMPDASRR